MTQKTVEITKDYLKSIQVKGHEKCFRCDIKFKIGDMLHAIIRNRGRSKFYHKECFDLTCH